ncbi:hypothetical protein [Gimesia panareensis]|uniref:Uncharacterized protein n=1 Tax=Gimesia panareensis TaxID=2527978 RepID=A0A517Q794_9PLAN|nr:hypothetical protein [Gimesia panareensis]QDT27500.1 hypothetical protein Enr10x_28170 [Gimesia panareensis]QDU49668.1 hypothetical protein Pan110_20070 [Gimesia panareensis]
MSLVLCNSRRSIHCFLILSALLLIAGVTQAAPNGNAVIRRKAGDSEIVITTTNRLAGAIHSLTWNGKEFIDSFDHGRQLQSAASFDCGKSGEFWAERFNPTEAGSRSDGAGPTSSSKLLHLQARENELKTTTQMAFWLAPGQKSSGRPALNQKTLSNHLLSKQVRIGYQNLDQVLDYRATFTIPKGEHHTYAQFEALTGYMPAEFELFWKLNPETGKLQPLDDGPGEQKDPVILSTQDQRYAMGVFSPDQPSPGFEHAGYGRFRFTPQKVVKWNCVFRVRNPQGVPPGKYAFQVFVAVGTLEDVKQAILTLEKKFSGK